MFATIVCLRVYIITAMCQNLFFSPNVVVCLSFLSSPGEHFIFMEGKPNSLLAA